MRNSCPFIFNSFINYNSKVLSYKCIKFNHLKRIKTTEKGWLFLNEVLEAFL